MMTLFSEWWKPKKVGKVLAAAQAGLLPEEEILFLGYCNNFKPYISSFALTELRLVAMDGADIKYEAPYAEIASLETDASSGTVTALRVDGTKLTIKMVPAADMDSVEACYRRAATSTPRDEIADQYQSIANTARAAAELEQANSDRVQAARDRHWPNTTLKGGLTRRASEAILRQCHDDEHPWLIITSSGGGILAAFEDRLVIIKTGAITSFMAGSLGGERSATFHFTDITGIEYNSGFTTGVLEILTPSYSGTINKDFWRGSTQSRNADSLDPWTLSNCLPLMKRDYKDSLQEINELKARISRSKKPAAAGPALAAPVSDLADQLQKLADLRDVGVLSDEEFSAAKARLLA